MTHHCPYMNEFLEAVAMVIMPCAGQDKGLGWAQRAYRRLTGLCWALFYVIPMIGGGIWWLVQSNKTPQRSYIQTQMIGAPKLGPKPAHLHVRTHNVAFLWDWLNTINDLRPVPERAKELVTWICEDQ